MTGWYRDGYCRTDTSDQGRHSVCCVVNESFLTYSRAQGNDLSTPAPAYGFPGCAPAITGVFAPRGGWRPTKTAWLHRCAWKPVSNPPWR
jgi:uncharacterized protein (DUF2237 family)